MECTTRHRTQFAFALGLTPATTEPDHSYLDSTAAGKVYGAGCVLATPEDQTTFLPAAFLGVGRLGVSEVGGSSAAAAVSGTTVCFSMTART